MKKITFLIIIITSFWFIVPVRNIYFQKDNHVIPENQSIITEPIASKNDDLKLNTFQGIDDYIYYEFAEQDVVTKQKEFYYLALGDSLTKGVGDEQKKYGYTKRLVEKIEERNILTDIYLDNRGKQGRRSDQLLQLLQKGHYDLELKKANFITITIGGNDIMKVVKEDLFQLEKQDFDDELVHFTERYHNILKEIRLRNSDVPILLIGLYNPFAMFTEEVTEFDTILKEWNNEIEQLAYDYAKVDFVKVDDLFSSNSPMVYHSDFFHPNGYGYSMITERIFLKMMESNIDEFQNLLLLKRDSSN